MSPKVPTEYHQVSSQGEPDKHAQPRPSRNHSASRWTFKHSISPLLAILLSLFIGVFIIGLQFFTNSIAKVKAFPSSSQMVYAMCLAFAATVCQRLILEEIQSLFIRWASNSIVQASVASGGSSNGLVAHETVNARWRTLMRVASVAQSIRNLHIYSTYIFAALITTAVVSACTPSQTDRSEIVSAKLPTGAPDKCLLVQNESDGSFFQWEIGNGSFYGLRPSIDSCPTRQVNTLAGNINVVNPAEFAYYDLQTAILPGAIGAPTTIYSPFSDRAPTLSTSVQQNAEGLTKMVECVPVLARNPASCRPGGTISHNESYMSITSADGLCKGEQTWPVNLEAPNAPAVQNMLCTKETVGQATIVMSALWGWGHRLAQTINDQAYLQSHSRSGDRDGYILTCDVDASSAIEFQLVTLDMQSHGLSASGFSKRLTSTGRQCEVGPDMPAPGPAYAAYAALSSWQILLQNYGNGGWFETINELANAPNPVTNTLDATVPRNTSALAFADSKNALEDVYGLVAGMMMARVAGSLARSNTTVTAQFYRVGGGHRFGAIYAIPNLLCAFVLVFLYVKVQFGAVGADLSVSDGGADTLPRGLQIDDLNDLFELGRLRSRQ